MRRPSAARRLALKVKRARERATARVRRSVRRERAAVSLESVQRRLELMIVALYDRPIPIVPGKRNEPWIMKVRTAMKERGKRRPAAQPGEAIVLPAALDAANGDKRALARFRLFAIEQAERIVRGTVDLTPFDDRLERDLFLVREAQAIDARIAAANPGLAPVLAEERAAALAKRPKLESLNPAEREVELLMRAALAGEPLPDQTADANDPAESLTWARERAARLRSDGAVYRGLPHADVWGPVRSSPLFTDPARRFAPPPREDQIPPPPAFAMGGAGIGDLESRSAPTGSGGDSGDEGRSDPFDTGGGVGSASTATQPNARVASPEQGARSGPRGSSGEGSAPPSEQPLRFLEPHELRDLPPAVAFPEWDSDAGVYIARGALVRQYESPGGDEQWATNVLHEHGALVREIRHRFERLRGRRMLLPRRRSGDEIDFEAVIEAMIDRNTGRSPDDRLYLEARPARRGIAIELLADVSGSTATPVGDDMRVIDLAQLALLLASEALDALGDTYAIHTFAGRSMENVKITPIKRFEERNGALVRRRIAGIEPGGFTRLGAAVRFAAQQLSRQSAGHRLLLILSDGRPNDVDRYQSAYGVEDARQAIIEARAAGIYPFCLTIDREGAEYLPRIFGQAGHTIVRHPRQLPAALLRATSVLIQK